MGKKTCAQIELRRLLHFFGKYLWQHEITQKLHKVCCHFSLEMSTNCNQFFIQIKPYAYIENLNDWFKTLSLTLYLTKWTKTKSIKCATAAVSWKSNFTSAHGNMHICICISDDWHTLFLIIKQSTQYDFIKTNVLMVLNFCSIAGPYLCIKNLSAYM